MKIKGGFEKARYYIESHSKEFDNTRLHGYTGPCITISRETGSGSGKVCEYLLEYFKNRKSGKESDWAIFDKNLIEKVLEDHNLPQKISEYLLAGKSSKISTMMNELFGVHPQMSTLIQKTSETILQLAQIGNVIIVGRGGDIITSRLENSFHVRLIAPLDDRIAHIQHYYEFGKKEALDFIKKEDESRKDYVFTHFHKQIDDQLLYHIIINTHLSSYEQTANIIGDAVVKRFEGKYIF